MSEILLRCCKRSYPILLLAAFFLFNHGPDAASAADANIREAYHKNLKLGLAQEPMAADFFGDGSPEIVFTDTLGNMVLVDAESGDERWRSGLKEVSLSAPLVGDFLGTGRQDIFVAGADGRFYLFSARNGERIASAAVDVRFTHPPALMPTSGGGKAVEDEPGRDRIVGIDAQRGVHTYRFKDTENVEEIWKSQTDLEIVNTPAVGKFRDAAEIGAGDSGFDIALADIGGSIYLLNGDNGALLARYKIPPGREIRADVALGDISGSAKSNVDEIFVSDNIGELYALERKDSALNMLWEKPANILGSPSHALTSTDFNGDKIADAVSSYLMDIVVADGVYGQPRLVSVKKKIATPLALGWGKDGRCYSFAFDEDGAFNTVSLAPNDFKVVKEVLNQGAFKTSPVVVATGEPPTLRVLAIEENGGKIMAFDTGILSDGDPCPWPTRGGSPMRAGRRSENFAERIQQIKEGRARALEHALGLARKAAEDGEWKEARAQANAALQLDPDNAEAKSIDSSATFRSRLVYYIAGAIAFLLLAWFAGRPALRLATRNVSLKNAEKAQQEGQLDRALKILLSMRAANPEDKDVNARLAILYMKQGHFGEDAIPVYEQAYGRNPGNAPAMQALARAYMAAGRRDQKALDVFLAAREQFDEPGPLHHAIGDIYFNRNEFDEARKYLKAAFRSDYRPQDLILQFADVNARLGRRSASSMAFYEAALAARPNDDNMLAALAETYAEANRMDEKAEAIYDKFLELRPDHPAIRLKVAKIRLRENRPDEAARHASRALDSAPDSGEALQTLALAHLARGKNDAEALAAYEKALDRIPDDKDILAAAAHIYVSEDKWTDARRAALYRAQEANPHDALLLRAAVKLAAEQADYGEVIRAGEQLVKSNEAGAEVWAAMADAYCEAGPVGEDAERALAKALENDPENTRWLTALAHVFAKRDRADAEALAIYDRIQKRNAMDVEMAAAYVHALLENGRIDDCVARAREWLTKAPGNEKVKRILAKASLQSNQVDEAIREYRQILKQSPNDKEATIQLATAYAATSRLDDEALTFYNRAMEKDPDNPTFPILNARALAEGEAWPAAIESLRAIAKKGRSHAQAVKKEIESILRRHPEVVKLRWLSHKISMGLGEPAEALKELIAIYKAAPQEGPELLEKIEKLLHEFPNEASAHHLRGRLLATSGNIDGAIEALEKALSLEPGERPVKSDLSKLYTRALQSGVEPRKEGEMRFHLGKLHYELEEYDKAIACFQSAAQDFRYESEATKLLGLCFMAKNMLDLAYQEFKKLHMDDEIKDLLYRLGERFEGKNDLVGAKTVYRQLFAVDVNYRNVKDKFNMLAGGTSDPFFEKTAIVSGLSEEAKRRYELLEEVGRGAMGIVYRAQDNELQEIVALKILPDNLSNNPEAVRRFKAEARSARRLSHPHIVRIHDIGEEMGRKYISMEYVEGTDLKKRIRSGVPIGLEELIPWMKQICSAMAYAHNTGIVHRDIKPANIMLTLANQIKVTDFGIAKIVESTEATMAGAMIGTPLYMSPEQVQGRPVDNRADIYAMGIMFYELVNGRPPFTEGDLAYQHLNVEPAQPANCPEPLWRFIERCLRKSKDERWPDVEEMLIALTDLG